MYMVLYTFSAKFKRLHAKAAAEAKKKSKPKSKNV